MWYGCGKWGTKDGKDAKVNIGGPSRTTRLKHSLGYTNTPRLNHGSILFLKLAMANDASFVVKPLIETPVIKVFGTAMENDSEALDTVR